MRYDQIRTTTDLQMAAHLERYQDLLREAQIRRQVKLAQHAEGGTEPVRLLQRFRQWINTPTLEPPTPTTGIKGV